MQSQWIAMVVAACAAGGTPLLAQQVAPRAREPRVFAFSTRDHRGRIGIVVRTDASPETDKLGAKIEGVTPGGPADRAGLKVGDIITQFSGTSLAGVPAEDEDESGPGHKLIALARRLEPGDTVQVIYRRGDATKTVKLVAERLEADFSFEMPEFPHGRLFRPMEHGLMCMGDVWCDLELVTLNAELGEYFGTKEGVLVVKAPADSTLPLKGGDVMLAIGGRKPTSPSHAMRILQSYDEGETVTIDIMRKQKRLTLTWKVPARGEPRFRVHREHNEESRSPFAPPYARPGARV